MEGLEPSSIDEYIERFKEQRRKLRTLVLNEDNELISTEEYYDRLESEFGIVVEERDNIGEVFTDKNSHDEENYESIISREDVPVGRGLSLVKSKRHPDDLKPVEERAKSQKEFDNAAHEKFEQQLEELDDPFPLELHVN